MGVVIMLVKYVAGIPVPIHFLLLAPILLVVSLAVNAAVSLATPPAPESQTAPNTWTRAYWRAETEELRGVPWYSNVRILALLLVIACFVEYFCFF